MDYGLPQRKLGVKDIGYWRFGLLVVLLIGVLVFFKYRQWTSEQETKQQAMSIKQEISTKQEILNKTGKTGFHFNGRAWKEMGDSKVLWVIGFNEGIFDGVSRIAKPKSEAELNKLCEGMMAPRNVNFAVVASEIDKLYEDDSNLPIPIAWAFDWTITKTGGATPNELQRQLANLRRAANEMQGTESQPRVEGTKEERQ
jgi:hypothetical protein